MRADALRRWSFPAARCAAMLTGVMLCAALSFGQASASDPKATQGHVGSTDDKDRKGQKEQKPAEPTTTRLKIRVTDKNDKPIANASVYIRFNEEGGVLRRDKMAEMDLKTNQDGSVKVPPVPQGKILIQVIATGWHTFGQWYDVQKAEETISIKLAPPPHWY